MSAIHWACLGRPPRVAPCGEAGTTDTAAEKHVKQTKHSVVTGTDPDALQQMVERFRADVVA